MWAFSSHSYKSVVCDKLAQRENALASESQHLRGSPALNHEILNATASEIVKRIEHGDWTATEVLEVYIARAVLANEATNCLTEVLFNEARKEAKALDKEFALTHKLRGPLHGVPVSIKDQFDIKGHDTTVGFTKYAAQPASEDAAVVKLVRAAGGIPFVKTNVPQTMFFFECSNPMWGRTVNPYNPLYTCGGSTGGEAALLAMDGSALGWGTDIGGSLRIPASFCGIYSFKPGWMRVSSAGTRNLVPGADAVHTVAGPMARSVDDLELAARVVFGKHGDDGSCEPAPVPFRDVTLPAKLRFGFYLNDGFVMTSPACQRAVRETVNALRSAGHACIEVSVPQPERPMTLFMGATSSDTFKTLASHIAKDPQEPALFSTFLGPKLYGWVRTLSAWFIEHILGDRVFSAIVRASCPKPVEDYWKITVQRDEYTKLFYDEVWDKHNLDGLIAPVLPVPGLKHGACAKLSAICSSTIIYNMINSPVGIVPVTRVTRADYELPEYGSPPGVGSPLCENIIYSEGGYYDVKEMCGLPVSVQVVGRQWEDEKTLAMMRVVDRHLGKRGFGPGAWAMWKKLEGDRGNSSMLAGNGVAHAANNMNGNGRLEGKA